jgi:hypothetical protein
MEIIEIFPLISHPTSKIHPTRLISGCRVSLGFDRWHIFACYS